MKFKKIIWALVFLITIAGALAIDDSSWSNFGKTQTQSHWTPYTASTRNHSSSCQVAGYSDTQPVIDDLDGDGNPEIVIALNDYLYVYDTECQQLASMYDPELDNRQPVIFDSLNCNDGKGIFILTSNSTEEWCFDTNLTLHNWIELSGIIDDYKGIAMANISGVPKGAFLINDSGTEYVEVCSFNVGVSCVASSGSGDTLTWGGAQILPVGNIYPNSNLEFPVMRGNSYNMSLFDFSLTEREIELDTSFVNNFELKMVYDDSPYDDIIIEQTHSQHEKYVKRINFAGTEVFSVKIGICCVDDFYMFSNYLQLGEGGDICFTYQKDDGGSPAFNSVKIKCINGDGDETDEEQICYGSSCNPHNPYLNYLTASDLDGDGFADFITNKGIYYYESNSSWTQVGYSDLDKWGYAIDLDQDIYRDLVFYGSSGLNVSLTTFSESFYDLQLLITDCSTGESVELAQVDVDGVGTDFTSTEGIVTFEGVGYGEFDVTISGGVGDYNSTTFTGIESQAENSSYYELLCVGEDPECSDDGDCGTNESCESGTCQELDCEEDEEIVDHECVVEQECDYNPVTYTYPVLWLDYFQYNDAITNHNYWTGYDFVIGDNPYDECDVLFYDTNLSQAFIKTDFPSPMYDDFSLPFVYAGYSPINETDYTLCGSPVEFYMWDRDDNICVFIEFGQDNDGSKCNITSYGNSSNQTIGYWDEAGSWWDYGSLWDYKFIMNMSANTFDFYYTDPSSQFSYILGCDNCEFYDGCENIETIGWRPVQPVNPENSGFWLDTISMSNIEFQIDLAKENFCLTDDCIYRDAFSYTDTTDVHGWRWFNITPSAEGVITLNHNPYEKWFYHDFDVFRSSDNDGVATIITRMKIGEQNDVNSRPYFALWSADLENTPIYMYFKDGIIFDVSDVPSIAVGTYEENTWQTFSWVLDLENNEYDLYVDESKFTTQDTRDLSNSIGRVGYYTELDNQIEVDYIKISIGTRIIDDLVGVYEEDGVSSEHLESCWDEGDFDWSCCSAEEEEDKSWGCVTRVTFFYGIASLTSFILKYILYVIVLAIIFVLLMPIILPNRRR